MYYCSSGDALAAPATQTLKPMELAILVHAIFSSFDAAVKNRNLFKMDTVGDAYVVAGLLPEDGDAGHVCREMLQVRFAICYVQKY